MQPQPQYLHPVKVYDQSYSTLKGVGKYATDFSAGTAPGDMFGDGRDGVMPSNGDLNVFTGIGYGSVSGSQGSTSISVTDRHAVYRINPGDVVLIHQTQYLRLEKQLFNNANLEALISNGSTGLLDLSIDIGADGFEDWSRYATMTIPATLSVSGLADAFNAYMVSRTDIEWGAMVDVPFNIDIDRKADVILTNMNLRPAGLKTRFLRMPVQNYDEVMIDLLINPTGNGSGSVAFTIDIGGDGTIDDALYMIEQGTLTYPANE